MRALPLVSDRDRIAAARYAVELVIRAMRKVRNGWGHTRGADYRIVSWKIK